MVVNFGRDKKIVHAAIPDLGEEEEEVLVMYDTDGFYYEKLPLDLLPYCFNKRF